MKERLIWPIIILIAALCCFFNHHGIFLSDEYIYSDTAWKLAHGSFELSNSAFANRFGFLLPMAAIIKLFGTSPYVLTLWTSLCLGILLIANYTIVHRTKKSLAIHSTLLLALNPTLLYYSADVSHDLAMTTFMSIAVLVLWQTQQRPNHSSILKSVLFVGCLIWAFLIKMTVIYAAPFVLLMLVLDFIKKQNGRFWVNSMLLGLGFLTIYLITYYQYTGDALYRFAGIEGEYNVSVYSYYHKSWKEILARVTALPFAFLLNTKGIGAIGLIAILGLISRSSNVRKGHLTLSDLKKVDFAKPTNFFGIYAFSLLLLFWFSSTSFASYNPIILADRMWMPLIPPITILASVTLVELKNGPVILTKWIKAILSILGFSLCVALFLFYDKLPNLSMPLLILIGIGVCTTKRAPWPIFTFLLFGLFTFCQFHTIATHKKNTAFFYEKEYIENLDPQKEHMLLVDKRFMEMPNAHFEWNIPDNITLKLATRVNIENEKSNQIRHLILNKFRKQHMPVNLKPLEALQFKTLILSNEYVTIYKLD